MNVQCNQKHFVTFNIHTYTFYKDKYFENFGANSCKFYRFYTYYGGGEAWEFCFI